MVLYAMKTTERSWFCKRQIQEKRREANRKNDLEAAKQMRVVINSVGGRRGGGGPDLKPARKKAGKGPQVSQQDGAGVGGQIRTTVEREQP